MTVDQWVAVILVALPALAGVYVSWRNSKKINEIHLMINSRLDELLAVTRSASHAEGMLAASKSHEGASSDV